MKITNTSGMLIQIGLSTQSQDQVITPQSFNTIKAIVRSPQNPIPLAVALDDALDDELTLMLLIFDYVLFQ